MTVWHLLGAWTALSVPLSLALGPVLARRSDAVVLH